MPIVELIDVSSVFGTSRLVNLTSRLVSRSRIKEQDEFEISSAEASTFLEEALLRHNPDYTWDTLPKEEEAPVILLAWKDVCMWRATQVSLQFPVEGQQGRADPSARFDNIMKLVERLGEEYDQVCEDLEIGAKVGESVTMGTLVSYDDLWDHITPLSIQEGPEASSLSVAALNPPDSCDLVWSENTDTDFYSYKVYADNDSGLADATTLNDPDADYKGVRNGAELLKTIKERHKTSIRISDLTSGSWFFVVVTEDINGKVAVSDEVEAPL